MLIIFCNLVIMINITEENLKVFLEDPLVKSKYDKIKLTYKKYQYRDLGFIFVNEEEFNKLKEESKYWGFYDSPSTEESEHYRWWCKNLGIVDNKNSLLKSIQIEDKNYYYDGIYYVKK